MPPDQDIAKLTAEIQRVQRSTRTFFPAFIRVHNWLRMKIRLYYWWHTLPLATALHVVILVAYTLVITGIGYHTTKTAMPVQANTLTTYDLATSTNYHLRVDGAAIDDRLGARGVAIGDLNGNGQNDAVIVAPNTDYNSRTDSGSIYVIYDSKFTSLTGKGNTLDFSDSSAFHVRFDAPQAAAFSTSADTSQSATISDYNGDGTADLLIAFGATDISNTNTGSLYLISSELLDDYTGTGNTLDLNTSTSYTIRIDGVSASDALTHIGTLDYLDDIDGDNKNDLIIGATNVDNGTSNTGSIYVISSAILDDYTGTGNALSLSDTSKFSIRYDGEAANWFLGSGYHRAVDINGNGENDLVLTSALSPANSRTSSGSVYIIYDDIVRSYSGTGNVVSLATAGTYNLRIDGATADTDLSKLASAIADIDGDGKNDVLVATHLAGNNARANSGSVWLLYNTLLDDYTGTGNTLDLGTSSNYNLRIDGATAEDYLSYNALAVGDFDNNTSNDILIGAARADHNSRTNSGSVYLISNDIISTYSDTGNTIDLSDTTKYRFRWDAATSSSRLLASHRTLEDLNGDGIGDLWFMAYLENSNSRSDSGSVYFWFNFPHTIATPSVEGEETSANRTVTGSVTASDSITTISSIQASVNTATFAGTWSDCTATDGTFDGRDESYSCSLTLPSTGSHTIRIRAKDSNGVYTPVNNYQSVSATYSEATSATPTPTPEATATPTPTAESSSTPTPTPPPTPDTTAPSLTLRTISGLLFKSAYKTFSYYSQRPRPIFAGTTEANATIKVITDSTELCSATADSSGAWKCTSSLLEHKDYAIEIIATDSAGNETKLSKFTLRIAAAAPSTASTSSTTATDTKTSSTPTPVALTLTQASPAPPSSGTYKTTISRKNGVLVLSEFQARLVDLKGSPLSHVFVALGLAEFSATSDYNGIVTFKNIPIGEHVLEHTRGKTRFRVPVSVALASDVQDTLSESDTLEITLKPVEIQLPIRNLGIAVVVWVIIAVLFAAIGSYIGYHRALKRRSVPSGELQ